MTRTTVSSVHLIKGLEQKNHADFQNRVHCWSLLVALSNYHSLNHCWVGHWQLKNCQFWCTGCGQLNQNLFIISDLILCIDHYTYIWPNILRKKKPWSMSEDFFFTLQYNQNKFSGWIRNFFFFFLRSHVFHIWT